MLNKKALRRFASENPAPAIPPNHGLLHAGQVDCIIRSGIRIIDHRRTLVLYVYDRKKAAGGDSAPVWTMFQTGDDYITLERRDDGSIRWREVAFENLSRKYYIPSKCAFYSARDEERVRSYFHDRDRDGIDAFLHAQQTIIDKRCRERQLGREREIISRMRPLHALPRGLKPWVRRDIMPAYFRCEHTSARKPVTGVCTSCGKESTLPGAAHDSEIICPHCRRKLTVKSAGKMGRHHDRDTVQVVESVGGGEVVIRIIKVYYNYDRNNLMPSERIHENARIFVRVTPNGKVKTEPYYFSYGWGTMTHWRPGVRPVFYYSENFEGNSCGHVYCRNLPEALKGTPWEYCPIEQFYKYDREPMQMRPFLAAHIEHPRLEHVVKLGFYDLASDLAYGRADDGLLDETQNRTHRILQVAAEDVDFLRELNANAKTLRVFQRYAGVRDRQRLLLWQKERDVSLDVVECLQHTTAHKLMRYIDEQYSVLRTRKMAHGGNRYWNMQTVVSEYRDYLEMCRRLGYDMANSFVLRPKDLQAAHDRVQLRVKIKDNERLRQDFAAAMESVSQHLDFELEGMKILVPTSPDDIIAEGQTLHHCVGTGTYIDRVAKHESLILFLRLSDNLDKPYYTVEVRNRKPVQVRGMQNCAPTPKVQAFIDQYEQQVLMAAAA